MRLRGIAPIDANACRSLGMFTFTAEIEKPLRQVTTVTSWSVKIEHVAESLFGKKSRFTRTYRISPERHSKGNASIEPLTCFRLLSFGYAFLLFLLFLLSLYVMSFSEFFGGVL
jgi:hypothetical protein